MFSSVTTMSEKHQMMVVATGDFPPWVRIPQQCETGRLGKESWPQQAVCCGQASWLTQKPGGWDQGSRVRSLQVLERLGYESTVNARQPLKTQFSVVSP